MVLILLVPLQISPTGRNDKNADTVFLQQAHTILELSVSHNRAVGGRILFFQLRGQNDFHGRLLWRTLMKQ